MTTGETVAAFVLVGALGVGGYVVYRVVRARRAGGVGDTNGLSNNLAPRESGYGAAAKPTRQFNVGVPKQPTVDPYTAAPPPPPSLPGQAWQGVPQDTSYWNQPVGPESRSGRGHF